MQVKKEFILQKKRVREKINEKKKKFYDNKFGETVHAPKLFWKNLRELLHNDSTDSLSNIEIKDDNGRVMNENIMADSFNTHFINLPEQIIQNEYGNLNTMNLDSVANFEQMKKN